ncbi:hypothetical protein BDW71DRAFT_191549 [Aspergillus fruticulosus]
MSSKAAIQRQQLSGSTTSSISTLRFLSVFGTVTGLATATVATRARRARLTSCMFNNGINSWGSFVMQARV